MKKVLSLLTIFVLISIFSGCRENPSTVNTSSKILSSDQTNTDEKSIGIIHLGYYENYDEFVQEIKTSKYLPEYTFLKELTKDEFISVSNGTETFAIIPTASTASVCVYKLKYDENLDKSQNGGLLYKSSQGKPIIVKCNSSDILPDANIIITEKDGTVTEFSPKTSMKDGKLEIVSKSEHTIRDLTEY